MADKHFAKEVLIGEIAAGETPASGQVALYAKSGDKKIYYKDSTGAESPVGNLPVATSSGSIPLWDSVSGAWISSTGPTITEGTLPDRPFYWWEKSIATLSGNGTVATLTMNSTAGVGAAGLKAGHLVFIGGSTPSAWNGLYEVLSYDGSLTVTLSTTKTDTYTSGAKIALCRPLSKFSPIAEGGWQGHIDTYPRCLEDTRRVAAKGSCDFAVGFDSSAALYSVECLWGNTSNPAWTVIGRTGFYAGTVYGYGNTVYLVAFRYFYNAASYDYNYQRTYVRMTGIGFNGVAPTLCGSGDFNPA